MQEQMKRPPARDMHKYVFGCVAVFGLLAGTYPIAFMRVSQSQKFAGFHVKSWTIEGKLEAASSELVAALTPNNSLPQKTATSGNIKTMPLEQIAENSPLSTLQETQETNLNPPATTVTDSARLKELNQKLYDQIAKDWQIRKFEQPLIYCVDVHQDGAIASVKPMNQPASDSLPQTPLPNLLQPSIADTAQTSRAEFRVVFTRQGILEVSPWHGWGR